MISLLQSGDSLPPGMAFQQTARKQASAEFQCPYIRL
jgi:hypothetical protein